MSMISLGEMRKYLSKSITSLNQNKLNGLLAEVDFRNHLEALGFQDRVSVGGWIARCEGAGEGGSDRLGLPRGYGAGYDVSTNQSA